MKYTLAFDVYGTLIDTSNVYHTLEKLMDEKATAFNESWRNKQLEYSFRRSAMGAYVDFSVVTREALEYCCIKHSVDLTENDKRHLMDEYKSLPTFSESKEAITQLKAAGHRIFAFSNGSNKAISSLLSQAKILDLFDGYVSLEDVCTFKPNPDAYAYFNEKTASNKKESWMISGNSFDVIGAANYGMRTFWVKRSDANIIDPWEIQPDVVVSDLNGIISHLL